MRIIDLFKRREDIGKRKRGDIVTPSLENSKQTTEGKGTGSSPHLLKLLIICCKDFTPGKIRKVANMTGK